MEMEWKSDQEKQGDAAAVAKPEAPKRQGKPNVNMTTDQMRAIREEIEAKEPLYEIQPVIVQTRIGGGNRVYMVRALLMKDMNRVEDLFKTLFREDVEAWKKKFEASYLASLKKKSMEDLDITEKDAFEAAQKQAYAYDVEKMMTKANDRAVNMVAVAWPENHASDVANEEVHAGDLETIAVTAQVMSGWSRMETDIDTYERSMIEERKVMNGQTEEQVRAEEAAYDEADR